MCKHDEMHESSAIFKVRHSLSHLMSMAVLDIVGRDKVGLGVGPVIKHGFYQDYDFGDVVVNENMFAKIEKRMKKMIQQRIAFEQGSRSIEEALEFYKNDPYKTELIQDLAAAGETEVSFFKSGWYDNLCKGPHVADTSEININGFKLMSVAGAYWKGDEKNKMLTRIYGVAFDSKEGLEEHLHMLEEAKKRDHRKLGKELELYFIDDMVGKGLIMWLPKGEILKSEIEKLAMEKERAAGFVRVSTPHIAKKELFLTSGHLPYYEEDMYPAMEMDDGTYYLRAMNCPHHHRVYGHKPRSYRELPLRVAEYGTVYRNELSGTLAGLLRVRGLEMNDAHMYCRKEQVKDEFRGVLQMMIEYFEIFGFEDYWFRLSKWDPSRKTKYIDQPENWEHSEQVLREVLQEMGVKYVEAEDEAAFYGPKVDVQFKSVIGREETMSTVQLDFLAKERFGLTYIDENGEENPDVFVIHRAPLSVHERFLAFLIEHYAGAFPVWLAPEQVRIVTVADRHIEFAEGLKKEIFDMGGRVEVDSSSETIGNKIRKAAAQKIPYTIVIGDNELEGADLQVKVFGGDEKRSLSREAFVQVLQEKMATRDSER